MFDPSASHPNHTLVRFVTNYVDPNAPTVPQDILIELLDDEAPLTVQNFLHYILEQKATGNYEGTFFHRAAPGFVLQGGGFDEKTRSHIDVGLELHNEFDPSRSNVRGTPRWPRSDPRTVWAEFRDERVLFNVGDNASNLDNQNGGFTVFARVLSGMEVVDAITDLPKTNTSSDGTGTPVQNYDSIPTIIRRRRPPLKHANLIVIETSGFLTRRATLRRNFRPAGGAVTDANGQPSDLVTARIDGTELHLE
jgi:cyclophilin family peptidyl-prolyl cis-trans isomerase